MPGSGSKKRYCYKRCSVFDGWALFLDRLAFVWMSMAMPYCAITGFYCLSFNLYRFGEKMIRLLDEEKRSEEETSSTQPARRSEGRRDYGAWRPSE